MFIEIIIFIIVIFIDLGTKMLIGSTMNLFDSVPLIENVFHITYVHNYGAAFSILNGKLMLFYVITPIAVAAFVYYLIKERNVSKMQNIALTLIISGALGNFYDRIKLGYVRDFLDFRLINFAVFNVADMALVIGTGLLILFLFKSFLKENKEEKKNKEDNAKN